MKIRIGIADDQQLFLKSLCMLINTFDDFDVICDALNGEELIKKIALQALPDVLLLDVNMPVRDGIDTAREIARQHPGIQMVALSMKDDDMTIINMIRAGCCAYLLKDIHPTELEIALREVYARGYYNADAFNINYRRMLMRHGEGKELRLNERERNFLQLACSDLTYKQIAKEMNLAERTIDGYRETLFGKFNVQSRVGLALEAVRRKLVNIT
jgi:DNA-binding NarL/FixJ family response regulator